MVAREVALALMVLLEALRAPVWTVEKLGCARRPRLPGDAGALGERGGLGDRGARGDCGPRGTAVYVAIGVHRATMVRAATVVHAATGVHAGTWLSRAAEHLSSFPTVAETVPEFPGLLPEREQGRR
ncbi:hypothetical protein ACSSS7_008072 [Eimeria intestinalis]